MKSLIDECTGASVVACLRDKGHDMIRGSGYENNGKTDYVQFEW